jgi:hypothetical protein
LAYSHALWRLRLSGQTPRNRIAAEAAIAAAYRASGLAEPARIIWAAGPTEAAEAVAFAQSPPSRSRVKALLTIIVGAGIWVGLTLALDADALVGETWMEAIIVSLAVAMLGLASGWARLPAWPMLPQSPDHGAIRWLALPLFVSQAAFLFAVQRLGGLPGHQLARTLTLAVAATVGALPGLLLALRIRLTYAGLPRDLRTFPVQHSVLDRLRRCRATAWSLVPSQGVNHFRAEGTLLEAYRAAYHEAFTRRAGNPAISGIRLGRVHRLAAGEGRRGRAGDIGRMLVALWESAGELPPHLDGLADAGLAVGIDRACARMDTARAFVDLAFYVDRLFAFQSLVVATEPVTTARLDAEQRPHGEDAASLAWADGTAAFAWHGRLVSPELIERNDPIDISHILRERDADRQEILIGRYGLGRFVLDAGADEIHRDECGRLYRLQRRRREPLVVVRVRNGTPEKDGTFREFWLRVPPGITTARAAVAWTFGLTTEQYDPIIQS